jgi:hypothetical protein
VFAEWCASLVAAGDDAQYSQRCRELLDREATDADAARAIQLAHLCTFAPDAVDDWQLPMQLAERAMAAGIGGPGQDDSYAWLLYRAGRIDEAAKRLAEAPESELERVEATRNLWLTMARFKLKQTESAQQLFEQADAWVAQNPDCYLSIKLLHREAQRLIAPVVER